MKTKDGSVISKTYHFEWIYFAKYTSKSNLQVFIQSVSSKFWLISISSQKKTTLQTSIQLNVSIYIYIIMYLSLSCICTGSSPENISDQLQLDGNTNIYYMKETKVAANVCNI